MESQLAGDALYTKIFEIFPGICLLKQLVEPFDLLFLWGLLRLKDGSQHVYSLMHLFYCGLFSRFLKLSLKLRDPFIRLDDPARIFFVVPIVIFGGYRDSEAAGDQSECT
ncbi:hypothetical protein D3C87_1720400 [compost metagenome]